MERVLFFIRNSKSPANKNRKFKEDRIQDMRFSGVNGWPMRTRGASLVAQMLKTLPAMQESWGSVPGVPPGGGNDNPLQYSCLENLHGQRSRADYSPWGCKESDMTEQLSKHAWMLFKGSPMTSLTSDSYPILRFSPMRSYIAKFNERCFHEFEK